MRWQHVLPLFFIAPALWANEQVEGIARPLAGGPELYREQHLFSGRSHRIDYIAPDGQRIAEKILDYSCSDTAPAFEQTDLRDGQRSGGAWSAEGYRLERGTESRLLESPEGELVASSGFDRYVRRHREALRAGETLEFDFALAERLGTLRLRIRREDAAAGTQAFRVEAASVLLRPFVPAIRLDYDEAGRLMRYRGLSNIDGPDGSPLQVEIRYSYSPAPAPALAGSTEPSAADARTPTRFICPGQRT
ncbi:MAG: hypothetical protein ACKO4A_17700 [Gammaproteobacteria bacterium]